MEREDRRSDSREEVLILAVEEGGSGLRVGRGGGRLVAQRGTVIIVVREQQAAPEGQREATGGSVLCAMIESRRRVGWCS